MFNSQLTSIFNPFTTIIGAHDANSYAWELDHAIRALISGNIHKLLYTTDQFYPYGITLKYDTPFVNAILALPAYIIGGPVFAYNMLLLICFVLTLFGMYLFLRVITKHSAGSFLGALGFTFCSYRLIKITRGHMDLLSSEWAGFCMYFLIRHFQNTKNRWFVLAAPVIYGIQAYSDYRTFLLLSFLLLPLFTVYGIKAYINSSFPSFIRTIAVFSMITLILISPLLYMHRTLFALSYVPNSEEMRFIDTSRSIALLEYFFDHLGSVVFLGSFSLAVVILYLIRGKKIAYEKRMILYWSTIGITFILLSLGLTFKIDRTLSIPFPFMPYTLIVNTPILKLFHGPDRFSFGVHVAFSVLVSFAFAYVLRSIRSKKWKTALILSSGCLIVYQYASVIHFWKDQTSFRTSQIFTTIQSGPFGSVLTIPFDYFDPFYINRRELEFQKVLFQQLAFRKPLIGGYVSYADDTAQKRLKNSSVLQKFLRCQRFYICEPLTNEDKMVLKRDYGVRYILITDTYFYAHVRSFLTRSFPSVESYDRGSEILYVLDDVSTKRH